MSNPREIGDYGGPFVDAFPVADPEQEQSADFAGRALEDTAQGTRTALRSWHTFTTTTTAAPTPATVTAGRAMSGSGSAEFPAVSKTGTGLYTLTYPATFVDGVGTTEANVYAFAAAIAWGAGVTGKATVATVAGNVITVEVRLGDGSNTLSDLGGTANITVLGE